METKTTTPNELTKKEVEDKIALKSKEVAIKAQELSQKLGVKVHPMTFITDPQANDFVIGYVREPSRLMKSRCLDRIKQGTPSFAYDELLTICLIKEESDERILSEKPEYDHFYLGACEFVGGLLVVAIEKNDLKKN